MAQCARDGVAPLQRSSAGWMPFEDWKLVHWCRAQASSHNWQDAVDGGVDEKGISTAAPHRSTVLCGCMHQG